TFWSISRSTLSGGSCSTWRVYCLLSFCTASFVAGGLVSISLPANASTYLSGGSDGFFVPVLAKIISCWSRRFLPFQNSWLLRQIRLALTMPTCPWAAGLRSGTCFSVYTSTRDTKMLYTLLNELSPSLRRWAPRQMFSRAALYCL